MTCPKCGAERPEGAVECPECGVIYERFEQSAAKRRAAMLTTCPACGKEVARQAPTCPRCGQPIAAGTTGGGVNATTREDQEEEKKKAASQAGMGCFIGCGGLILICIAILVFGDVKEPVSTPPPQAAPKMPSVPRTVSILPHAFGCHDIGDFWLMVAEARKGDVRNFSRVMSRYADQGKCDMVRVRTATALEFLPSGAVRIRDANNVLWWVSDASVR